MFKKTTSLMRYYSGILFILLSNFLFAQNEATKPYFQQEVNFDIQVSLDDHNHNLHGQWQMEYINNSPDTLHFIYIHLWPNAYRQRNTAFANQELSLGDTQFYFTDDKNLGGIDSLAFESNGQKLSIETTKQGVDVIKLILKESLLPSHKVIIKSPFSVRIPGSFSRLGHVGQSYQITQWYPKPAVYDRDGWHPMPYLDYGEFYSEFGQYDVAITLPKNYIIGSTGTVQDKDEREWLLEKATADAQKSWTKDDPKVRKKADFPATVEELKTVHYHAENVHDFAWFADKRFYVLHDTVQLSSGKIVDAWAYFTDREADLWQHSMKYIKRSTHFYSNLVGEYPYPQVSALQSALSAGGGMEYPMVTVIGLSRSAQSLDEVITHEVGHNWFYGILGSNERDHSWMDEGFNSYYDRRYTEEFYGDQDKQLSGILNSGPLVGIDELGYRYFACQAKFKAPDTPAGDLPGYNYWLGSYSVPAIGLKQLEIHIGKNRFDAAFQAYYQQWKFKHPQPEDAQKSIEKASGEDLGWFFQGLMGSGEVQDYGIKSVKQQGQQLSLDINNNGHIEGPFTLVAKKENGEKVIRQVAGFENKKTITLAGASYHEISIDPLHTTADVKRKNNYWNKKTKRFEPPKIRLLSIEKDETRSNLFLTPLLIYNKHDGVMPGIGLFNRAIIPVPFEFWAFPSYGVKSKELVGLGAVRYRWWPNSDKIQEVSFFSSFRHFNFDTYEAEKVPLGYNRFVAGVKINFPAKRRWRKSLQFRNIRITEEDETFNNDGVFTGLKTTDKQINELMYSAQYKWVLSPFNIDFALEQSNYVDAFNRDQNYVKLRVEAQGKVLYKRKKAFYWRFFGGLFLHNTLNTSTFTPPNSFNLFDNSIADNRYDNLYLDRTATAGFLDQQLPSRAGGFHAPVAAAFPVGKSNRSLFSVNLLADLPFTPKWLPIKPYVDVGSFTPAATNSASNQLLWNGGLAMEWINGKVGVYLPLVGSPEIMDRLKEQGGVIERISFRIIFRDLSPWKWLDGIETL